LFDELIEAENYTVTLLIDLFFILYENVTITKSKYLQNLM